MDLAKPRWLIVGLAFALGLVLLGRWALHHQNQATGMPARVESIAPTPEQGTPEPPRTNAESAPPKTVPLAQQPTADGGEMPGIWVYVRLDEEGVGSLPSALAGSTLSFSAPGFEPITMSEWNAQPIELRFRRR